MSPARTRPGRVARTVLPVIGLTLALGACGVLPPAPEPLPTSFVPSEVPLSAPTERGNLSPDGFGAAQRMAARVRNIGCEALSTGSSFALDATTLITNKHVVADAASLQISTYDGRDVTVTASSTADLADLAVVRTAEELPAYPTLAEDDPVRGDAVTVVGYPLGGALTVTSGHVIGETTDPLHENLGQVLVTDAPVEPGSSGSAVLDEDGRLVGVVYAKNEAGQSYIVPVSTVRLLLVDDDAFSPTTGCSTR